MENPALGGASCKLGGYRCQHTRTAKNTQAIRETAEHYPHVIARLSEHWRVILCPQGIQWIAQRRDPNGARWRSISFFRTSHWLRQLCKNVCEDPAAWRTLERLPENVSGREKARQEGHEAVSGCGIPAKAPAAVASGADA